MVPREVLTPSTHAHAHQLLAAAKGAAQQNVSVSDAPLAVIDEAFFSSREGWLGLTLEFTGDSVGVFLFSR
jgi:hypothetical protein